MSDFRSDDSFPVKTASFPTAMVDPSFDAEYPTLTGLVPFSALGQTLGFWVFWALKPALTLVIRYWPGEFDPGIRYKS